MRDGKLSITGERVLILVKVKTMWTLRGGAGNCESEAEGNMEMAVMTPKGEISAMMGVAVVEGG
jgi:hypothetical protein